MDLVRRARTKPKWLILENVIGLLSANEGKAFEAVVDEMEAVGYLGGWTTANTLDFGLPKIENESSLSQVLEQTVPIKSLLTAANCGGIIRREEKNGRPVPPKMRKALEATMRLCSSAGEVSGTPREAVFAPRYVPSPESIKEVIQTGPFYVARNLTWIEWERLMGFPDGWTVVEGD